MNVHRQRALMLVTAWLGLFPMAAQAEQPSIHVKVDFTCRGAPASYDMFDVSISIAGEKLRGSLIEVAAGRHELKINTNKANWHITRIDYLDIGAQPPVTVTYQHAAPEETRELMFTERPSRSVVSTLRIVVDTCATPRAPPAPAPTTTAGPPPKPPPAVAAPTQACLATLADEYARLQRARSVLQAQLNHPEVDPLTLAARPVLRAGIEQLASTASAAAANLARLGDGIAMVVDTELEASMTRKGVRDDHEGFERDVELARMLNGARQKVQPLLQEWGDMFRRKAGAATAIGQDLPGNTREMRARLQRYLDQVDVRILNSQNLAGELRCRLPSGAAPAVGKPEEVLVGLHPPLDLNAPAAQETITKADTIVMNGLSTWLTQEEFGQFNPLTALAGVIAQANGTTINANLQGGRGTRAVRTPEATVTPNGTAYLVHRDVARQLTFVYVSDGAVSVTPMRGAAVQLAAGQAALVSVRGARLLAPRAAGAQTPASNAHFELATNRQGSDYANLELPRADPQLCFDRCQADGSCRAWTYVKPGVQGASARCYLKNPAPPATPNECCVSGAIPRGTDQQAGFEVNVNRGGSDYASFDLPTANPDQCFERCRSDQRCAAWTFVRAGVQGAMARCYLKNPAPAPTPNNCCVSGAIPRTAAAPAAPATPSPSQPPSAAMPSPSQPPPVATPASNPRFELATNRQGSDYANLELPRGDPQLCFERCQADGSCRAWTYVKPGVQGANARCYLKSPAPPATANECCVSGVIPRVIDQQVGFEVNVNRGGSDYAVFDLQTANPDQCFERCRGDARCAAWTFVRPGVQGPLARCYLKNPAPAPTPNNCCVSGAIPRAAAPAAAAPAPVPSAAAPPVAPQASAPAAGGDCWSTSPTFFEDGVSGWQGIYTRRGSSNVFDAAYARPSTGESDTGELRLVREGAGITIDRYYTRGGYKGVFGARIRPDGTVADGKYPGGNEFTLRCGGAQSQGYRVPPTAQAPQTAQPAQAAPAPTPLTQQRPPPVAVPGPAAQAQPPQRAGQLLGCFRDPNNPFDLDGHLERSAQNTPQRCVQICAGKSFKYAGVQYAESCLCGNTYGKFGQAANCNMRCTGDPNQICGGGNANSVYSTGR